MSQIRKVAFNSQPIECKKKRDGSSVVNALLMYEGDFTDAAGQAINVSTRLLESLEIQYSAYINEPNPISKAIDALFGTKVEPIYKPVSLNHNKSDVTNIIGRVLSLSVKKYNGQTFLFGRMKILGEENIARVNDSRFLQVSISFDYEEEQDVGCLTEISYVFDGAVENALSFAKDDKDITLGRISKSIEMSRVKCDIDNLRKSQYKLEIELQRSYSMQKAHANLESYVREGLISRADFKRLFIDLKEIRLMNYEPVTRMVKTVAMSKKAQRGQVSNNLQMSAIESFVNHITENGVDMNKDLDVKAVAKKLIDSFNMLNNKNKVVSDSTKSFAVVDTAEKTNIFGGMEKEQGHQEAEHVIKFTHEDMHRMAAMARGGKTHDLLDFMGESSGLDFEYDEKTEDNDEIEHHGDKEGYGTESERVKGDHRPKMKRKDAKSHKKHADHDMGEGEDEDREAEGEDEETGERDYKKERKHSKYDYEKQIKDQQDNIVNLSKELKRIDETMVKLTDTLYSLSNKAPEGDK